MGADAIGFVVVSQLLLFGPVLGIAAFRNVFLERGVFADVCDDHETQPCHAQERALALTFAFVINVGYLACWPTVLVMERTGPKFVARVVLNVFVAAMATLGLWPANGIFFVIALATCALCASAMGVLGLSFIIPAATRNDGSHAFGSAVAFATAAIDYGCVIAIPSTFIVAWQEVSLWGAFAIIATVIGLVLLTWHYMSIEPLPRPLRLDETEIADEPLSLTSRQLSPFILLRLARMPAAVVSVVLFSLANGLVATLEVSSGHVAPAFHELPSVQLYVPLAVAIGALPLSAASVIGFGHRRTVMFGLRFAALCLAVLCWAVPAFRANFTFWAGLSLASVWRLGETSAMVHWAARLEMGSDVRSTARVVALIEFVGGCGAIIVALLATGVLFAGDAKSKSDVTLTSAMSVAGFAAAFVTTVTFFFFQQRQQEPKRNDALLGNELSVEGYGSLDAPPRVTQTPRQTPRLLEVAEDFSPFGDDSA
jgi:hypothetical protein